MMNLFLVFNEHEWNMEREYKALGFNWSVKEIEAAKTNSKNLIGTKYGVDCYLSVPIKLSTGQK